MLKGRRAPFTGQRFRGIKCPFRARFTLKLLPPDQPRQQPILAVPTRVRVYFGATCRPHVVSDHSNPQHFLLPPAGRKSNRWMRCRRSRGGCECHGEGIYGQRDSMYGGMNNGRIQLQRISPARRQPCRSPQGDLQRGFHDYRVCCCSILVHVF